MSQDSSTALDKVKANFIFSIWWVAIFEHISIVLSLMVLADNETSSEYLICSENPKIALRIHLAFRFTVFCSEKCLG